MTHKTTLLLAVTIFAFGAAPLSAGHHDGHADEHEMVIALKTDDFELVESDISDLEIGDAQTVYTDSGKTVDLLRTEDGVEIYVDGELLDIGLDGTGGDHAGRHVVHKYVEVECDSDTECAGLDLDSLHGEGHHEKVIIIR